MCIIMEAKEKEVQETMSYTSSKQNQIEHERNPRATSLPPCRYVSLESQVVNHNLMPSVEALKIPPLFR